MQCRLCGTPIGGEPLFRLDHAPAGAQLFTAEQSRTAVRLDVNQCGACGLIQLVGVEPVPYYRSTITAAGLSPEMREFRLAQFSALSREFGLDGKRVVEIGAAKGLLTDLLAAAGMAAFGIEGGAPAEGGLTPEGNPLSAGYPAPGQVLAGAPYDGFVCINFLEHAPAPVDFLRGIAASLSAGAVGIVEVPAFEHMIEGNLSYDWVADHLSYFTSDSLRLALELAGFEVLRIERVWHGYDWAATIRRRPRLKLDDMRADYDQAIASLRGLVAGYRAAGRVVAVWGASHQALTLLTDCRFDDGDVAAIIDSAPFKQGRFAPGCGLPVVAPAWLQESNVDAVVIMAAGYSHEVAKQLRQKFGFTGEAAIFKGSQPPIVVD